ncbi:hypothetical protein [Neptuniibacter marinus]|uniref:hypothetical protein n=1 Tax=Neptuniibacter marinus TaxID=1806670 RepID=UPI000AE3C9EE|nr:hypothetical protein [Neptuniibacter marinus]
MEKIKYATKQNKTKSTSAPTSTTYHQHYRSFALMSKNTNSVDKKRQLLQNCNICIISVLSTNPAPNHTNRNTCLNAAKKRCTTAADALINLSYQIVIKNKHKETLLRHDKTALYFNQFPHASHAI